MSLERRTDDWGRVILDPDSVFEAIYNGHDVWSMLVDNDSKIEQFNSICQKFDHTDQLIETPSDILLSPEEEHKRRSENWLIADEIKTIDIKAYLLFLCKTDKEKLRVEEEMALYEDRDLLPLLQLMLYLVDHFRNNNIVWGVGRGSSVASFVLYLIGVHKINPMLYGLEITDFLKN